MLHRTLLHYLSAWLVIAAVACRVSTGEAPDWSPSPWFEEHSFTSTLPNGVRFHVNAPLDSAGEPAKATRLIIYALPAGNTIEQTLGAAMKPGLDWHYDIQHVAAQTRLLRSLDPNERIVLICAEAPKRYWGGFRQSVPDANKQIAEMVDSWRKLFGTDDAKVTLTGHSAGGAFMFGVIEAADEIPAYIDRIAFLDANYSFDAALHDEKIKRWLEGDQSRRLVVIAYDDREITLDGKKVVSPTGGTFRATGRMRDALGAHFALTDSAREPFHETVALDGRIHFYVHPNLQNKILHTALVGEMNGLVHAATLGTPHEETWGKFGGPRAYTMWVQPEPTAAESQASVDEPSRGSHEAASARLPDAIAKQSQLPARPADAMSGSQFVEEIKNLSLDDREAAIVREITRGNFPDFLRDFKVVSISGRIQDRDEDREVAASIAVMPDYLAVGSDEDFIRMPMRPQTAQKIAEQSGCVLPTRKMVDAIDAQAGLRIAPHPMTEQREAVETFAEHNDIIQKQIGLRADGQLVTGIKKDIVLTPRVFERPQRLAIYGWRQLDGKPIQPLTIVHWDRYVDYSHGVRLVRNRIEIDGKEFKITGVLEDADRCGLISDEGPMKPARYPDD
jgi:hypothetical protein